MHYIEVFKFLQKYFSKNLFKVLIYSLVISLLEVFVAYLIFNIASDQNFYGQDKIIVGLIAVFLQISALSILYRLEFISASYAYAIASEIYKKSIDMPLIYFESNDNKELASEIYNESNRIALNIVNPFVQFTTKLVLIILMAILVIFKLGLLALWLLAAITSLIVISSILVKSIQKRIGEEITGFNRRRLFYVNLMVNNILEIKANFYEGKMAEKNTELLMNFSAVQGKNQFLLKFPKYFLETILVVLLIVLFSVYPTQAVILLPSLALVIKLLPAFQGAYINYSHLRIHSRILPMFSKRLEQIRVDDLMDRVYTINSIIVERAWNPHTEKVLINEPIIFVNGTNALVGESGSGKSTLLKLILGLYGDDYIVGRTNCENNLKLIPHNCMYYAQNTTFLMEDIKDYYADYDEKEYSDLLDKFEIGYLLKRTNILSDNGKSLSGGERQRIVAIHALLSKKTVIFLDEVFVGMPLRFQKMALHYLNSKSSISVLISHQDEVISRCHNRISIG